MLGFQASKPSRVKGKKQNKTKGGKQASKEIKK